VEDPYSAQYREFGGFVSNSKMEIWKASPRLRLKPIIAIITLHRIIEESSSTIDQ
jgi:hypothetical protein